MKMDDATYERMLDESQQVADKMANLSSFISAQEHTIGSRLTPKEVNLLRSQYAAMETYHRILSLRIDSASEGFKARAAANYAGECATDASSCLGGIQAQVACAVVSAQEAEWVARDLREKALALACSVREKGCGPDTTVQVAKAFENYLTGADKAKQEASVRRDFEAQYSEGQINSAQAKAYAERSDKYL